MPQLDFSHSQQYLKQLANDILNRALKLGATSAQLEINESIETGVAILNENIDNFETSYDSELLLCVFIGNNRGNISISQVPPIDIDLTIKKALDIAKYTQADPYNGLPDEALLCKSFDENLELYNPIPISNEALIYDTQTLEKMGLSDKFITASDGANISLAKYNFVIANTHGLNLGYQTTRYSKSISLIGKTPNGDMHSDYWYSNSRDFNNLASNKEIATIASNRVKRRLTLGNIKSGTYPVIFESTIAKSLISNFFGAINGSNIYRKLTFLGESLGSQVFPKWVNIFEDPFVIKGNSSCYFDSEGVKVCKRNIVSHGTVNSYILSSYTARQLNLQTTGNAGGTHNVFVEPNIKGGIDILIKQLVRGLIIIETIGHGVNMVTGDYSVGASALWVENSEIQFFVNNLTISGNLKEIYSNIKYISDDYNTSSIGCGSILVENIFVSS